MLIRCAPSPQHTLATVFNTSFTTAMAFVSTGFSPLMPIATFGWFAATCVLLNYLFVITLMPPVVIISEMWLEGPTGICGGFGAPTPVVTVNSDGSCDESGGDAPDKQDAISAGTGGERTLGASESSVVEMPSGTDVASDYAIVAMDDGAAPLGASAPVEDPKSQQVPIRSMNSVTFALCGDAGSVNDPSSVDNGNTKTIRHYINFMEAGIDVKGRHIPVVSLLIVVGLLVFGVTGAMYGLQLETPTEQEQWYPQKHMFTQIFDSLSNDFLGAQDNAYENVQLTFGIKDIDRSSYNIYEPGKNRGKPVYDRNWDLSEPSCQKAFVKMCQDIPRFECKSKACKPTSRLARDNTTECFMIDFRVWADEMYSEDTYTMNRTIFFERLEEYRNVGLQKYHAGVSWQDQIGFIDGELSFATVLFTSTMESEATLPYKLEVSKRLEDLVGRVKRYEECNDCDCDSLFYTSDFAFVWMRSEQGLVKGFYQGLSIAFPVAFVVVLFATGNILISIYAIATVFFIVFGVLGFAKYALHWNLGISESIAGIIIIGFSVDYTVHLGHMYNEAEHNGFHTRKTKFEFASEKIVITIVGGAITTVGAGIFMFACQLRFFYKMAALIVSTILLSYIYSLGFFMALLYVAGPEMDEGNVVVYYHRVKAQLTQWWESRAGNAEGDESSVSTNARKVSPADTGGDPEYEMVALEGDTLNCDP